MTSFRPAVHFTPARNWINDPNGLVWFEGEYHLFYQYNPFGDVWGHMSWGHAVSEDLIDWTELPVAIPEDERDMIFSGSAVCDAHNSSGLGQNGAPVLVAIYTGAAQSSGRRQTQNLAFSVDRGRIWTKFANNPVLDLGLEHFRDPKVFWHAATHRWIMIVALSDQQKVALFASTDLRNWTLLSEFGPEGAPGTLWECPDLFPLPDPGRAGGVTWVLKVDMFSGGVAGGPGAQVFFGDFDGVRFVPDRLDKALAWRWADFGKDFYAAMTWSNLPGDTLDEGGGALWVAWMSNHTYAARTPTSPWRGAMTLPRRLSIARRDGAAVLIQKPIAALETRRGQANTFETIALSSTEFDLMDLTIGEGVWDVELKFSCDSARMAGVHFDAPSGDRLTVGYESGSRRVFVDRSGSGLLGDDADFTGSRWAPRGPSAAHEVDLRLVLDRSSIEVFVDGGAAVITEQVFPREMLKTVRLFAQAGDATFARTVLWPLGGKQVRGGQNRLRSIGHSG